MTTNQHRENKALKELNLEFVLQDEGIEYKVTWGRSGKQLNLRVCPFCGNDKSKVYANANSSLGNCFAGSCTQGTFNKWQLLGAIWDLQGKDLEAKINIMAIQQGWFPYEEETERFDPGPCELPRSIACEDMASLPDYLVKRNVDRDIAAHFGLRYSENGWFEVQSPDGRILKQNYSQRIIIPIWSLQGELKSFQGRDVTGESDRRYLFPPLFSSNGSQIYNIQNWKEGMDSIVITEGPFDAIGVYRALRESKLEDKILAAASFGMSFSESKQQDDQVNRLLELKARGLRKVYFMWDNEGPALQAALKACEKVMPYGFEAHLVRLEGAKDPGEASTEQIITSIQKATHIKSALQAMLLRRTLK